MVAAVVTSAMDEDSMESPAKTDMSTGGIYDEASRSKSKCLHVFLDLQRSLADQTRRLLTRQQEVLETLEGTDRDMDAVLSKLEHLSKLNEKHTESTAKDRASVLGAGPTPPASPYVFSNSELERISF